MKILQVAAIAAALALAGCGASQGGSGDATAEGGSAGSGETTTIELGYAPIAGEAELPLGIEHGIFIKHGIDLKLMPLATAAAGVAQLVNGQLQVVVGGITTPVTSTARGIPMEIVSGVYADRPAPYEQVDTVVPAGGDIKSFRDLEGKTVGVNSVKCCYEWWDNEAVREDGGDPSKVHYVQIPFGEQVTALEQKRVDAVTALQPVQTQLMGAGLKSIGDPAAIAYGTTRNVAVVSFMYKGYVSQHPDVVKRWVEALTDAASYANTHPDELRTTIVKETGAPAALISRMPLPDFTAEVNSGTVSSEAQFLVRYGIIGKVPSANELIWPGARSTSVANASPAS